MRSTYIPDTSNQSRAERLKSVICCPAQLTGPVITPFNVQKQNALLSVMARTFPRLPFGVGPERNRIVAVTDDAEVGTASVTMIMTSDGDPQAFAEVRCMSKCQQCCIPSHACTSGRTLPAIDVLFHPDEHRKPAQRTT